MNDAPVRFSAVSELSGPEKLRRWLPLWGPSREVREPRLTDPLAPGAPKGAATEDSSYQR
jgi:hypothetical protein